MFLFWMGCFPLYSTVQSQTLTVVVRGVRNNKGMVRVALYNSEKDFMKKILHSKSEKAKSGEVQIVLGDIPPGTYAISVVHDANENGEMDSNSMGIPKEGFGFSNNAMRMFGPPSFEEAKFVWDGQKKMEINLKYY